MAEVELREHLVTHVNGLLSLEADLERLQRWGERLADALLAGGRLLACGNGGSAAEAQHLVAELVGRFRTERRALSAIAIVGDSACLTGIANDYGWTEGLARQVIAHGRPGDVLIALSTSGCSENVLAAARAAHDARMSVWGLTGPAPNPLHRLSHDAIAISGSAAVVQELHLVAIHLLCTVVDATITRRELSQLPEAG